MRATLPSIAAAFFAEGDRRHRRGSIGADAGKRSQARLIVGKATAAPRNLLGAGVEIARPGVIAEPGEGFDHFVEGGGGERLDPRPAREEAPVIGGNGGSGGLLQQDFRQPDVIGIGRLARRDAPRQVAAVDVPPSEQAAGERARLQSRAARV